MVVINKSNNPNRLIIGKDNSGNRVIVVRSNVIAEGSHVISKKLKDNDNSNNIILLSGHLKSNDVIFFCIPITRNNLEKNIGHVFIDNSLNNSRIVFFKTNNKYDEALNYLIPTNNINAPVTSEVGYTNNNNITVPLKLVDKFSQSDINYYDRYENSDYYKVNFLDFIRNTNSGIETSANIIFDFSDTSLTHYLFHNKNIFNNLYTISNNKIIIKSKNDNIYTDLSNILIYSIPGIKTGLLNHNFDYSFNILINETHKILNTRLIVNNNVDNSNKIKIGYNASKGTILEINSRAIGIDNNNLITNYNNNNNNNNKIYLSLGNGICGVTQNNIFNNIKLNNTINSNKIYISNFNNTTNITNTNNYLIDNSYNYNYIYNFQYNIFNIQTKILNIDLQNYYDNSFNGIKSNNIELTNPQNQFKTIDFFNNTNAKFTYIDLSSNPYNMLTYDFRFNYGITFTTQHFIRTFNDANDLYSNIFNIETIFTTNSLSDFNNVECIFIYYDPASPNTPAEFKYPNNNIDICSNSGIDSFVKAIETLPELRTSNTNATFIPQKNGSNYSRKQIIGLIGFNDVERLLSIKPYDPTFTNGRDSTDLDIKFTEKEQIQKKINSTKYNKDITVTKQQFKNLVLNPKLNQNSIITNNITCPEPDNTSQKYTPFRMFRTGRSNRI